MSYPFHHPFHNVQAVRTCLGILCIIWCLAVLGCQLPKRSGRGADAFPTSKNAQPFLGTPVTDTGKSPAALTAPAPADSGNLTSGGNSPRRASVLAGKVLDSSGRLRPDALIQIIDLDSPRDHAAPLSVKANREGYFDIASLEAGHTYRLVARVREGVRILIGSRRAVPPDIRVVIFLTEEQAATNGPGQDEIPGGGPLIPPGGPTAALGVPIRPGEGVTTPLPGSSSGDIPRSPGAGVTLPPSINTQPAANPEFMAGRDRGAGDGFNRDVPSPKVNIPAEPGRDHKPEKPAAGTTTPIPPPPTTFDDPQGGGLAPSSAPSAAASVAPAAAVAEVSPSSPARADVPETTTVVPSCVRIGDRVENFALYDVRGKVYELARHRKGKLVLLDFWFTDCMPCRRAVPKLNALQAKYRKYGLEVIGITRELGSLAEKQDALEQARKRHGLSFAYTLLFTGDGANRCPVTEQLEVVRYPTLVLLDETGRILLRVQGLDAHSAYDLEMTIRRHLFPERVASER